MKRLDERGNVLLYTLVGSIIATVLAVSIAQMLLSRAAASAKITAQTAAQREDEAVLGMAFNSWNANGVCAAIPSFTFNGTNYSYACGTAGNCGCTCTPSPACTCSATPDTNTAKCPPTITTSGNATSCQVNAISCQ